MYFSNGLLVYLFMFHFEEFLKLFSLSQYVTKQSYEVEEEWKSIVYLNERLMNLKKKNYEAVSSALEWN